MIVKIIKDTKYVKDILEKEKKIFLNDAYSEAQITEMIEKKEYKIVAIIEDEIVGYGIFHDAIDIIELIKIGVLPEKQRQGIGEKIMAGIEEIRDILLEVRESNKKAINFYKKLGFKECSKRKNYYRDGETAIIMIKNNR